MTILDVEPENVFAHRSDLEGATIVAVHELAGRPASVALGVQDGESLVDLFGPDELALPATLHLEPFDARWFRVRRKGMRLPP
jgi:maltose alpha-D-glucosyltransferase/alpha-amylase